MQSAEMDSFMSNQTGMEGYKMTPARLLLTNVKFGP